MSLELLDNVFWHSLNGVQARFSQGTDVARRYAVGFSPIVAFAEPRRPDFDALLPYCDVGDHFYCAGWSGPAPANWTIDAAASMFQMVWAGEAPPADDTLAMTPLEGRHAPQMVALATLVPPGPFGLRTVELGVYLGVFDGVQLVAMAGERSAAGALREVSGVCTHPDFQGRGYARALMLAVIRLQLARQQIPFLHVMENNVNAHRMYVRMGFRIHQSLAVRVVTRVR
ncbi:MAG: GNAT family N-acetyltransferase [Casimicrobiaceae bacterium]